MHDFVRRYQKWLRRLTADRLDGFLVTHPPNLAYLFNFTGSSGAACCLSGETDLLVDSRYLEQARSETVNCRAVLVERLQETLRSLLCPPKRVSPSRRRIGIEARHTSYEFVLRLQSWEAELEWVPTLDLIEEIRMVKETSELQILDEAFALAEAAYQRSVKQIRPGMAETEVSGILEFELRRAGGEGTSFTTIVASGARSALPHGTASRKRIGPAELVLIDFGMRYKNYCTDLTRIHLMPEARLPEIHAIVEEARNQAFAAIKPGVPSSDVDRAARKVISDSGYGDYFGHSTGHGVGLEVHELPAISFQQSQPLEPGMVFSVEPAIYLPGRYGIRLEDVVVVTPDGYRLLVP